MADSRETQLLHTFVELAGAVVQDFDIAEFLHLLTRRVCGLLDVPEAGLLLATGSTLHVMAFSSERARSLEVFALHHEEGPCVECFRTGSPVIVDDLEAERVRWPHFVPVALAAGLASIHALPLRLRQARIGVLGLFGTEPGRLAEADLVAAQAMADMGTIAILQRRNLEQSETTSEQLRVALASRIAIEQAKGILAERSGLPLDDSFHQLRLYARAHNLRLHDVAQDVVSGKIPPGAFVAPEQPVRGGRGRGAV